MDSVCPKNYVQSHAFYANQIHVESMSWVQSNTQILKTEMTKHNNVVSLNTLNAKKMVQSSSPYPHVDGGSVVHKTSLERHSKTTETTGDLKG